VTLFRAYDGVDMAVKGFLQELSRGWRINPRHQVLDAEGDAGGRKIRFLLKGPREVAWLRGPIGANDDQRENVVVGIVDRGSSPWARSNAMTASMAWRSTSRSAAPWGGRRFMQGRRWSEPTRRDDQRATQHRGGPVRDLASAACNQGRERSPHSRAGHRGPPRRTATGES